MSTLPLVGLRTGDMENDVTLIYKWIEQLLLMYATLGSQTGDGLIYFTSLPTTDDLNDGRIGFSYVSGTLYVHLNDGGVIKTLSLGEPAV